MASWKHLLGDFRNVTIGPKSAPRILDPKLPFILSEVKQSLINVYDKLLEIETDLQPRSQLYLLPSRLVQLSCHIQAAWSALTQTHKPLKSEGSGKSPCQGGTHQPHLPSAMRTYRFQTHWTLHPVDLIPSPLLWNSSHSFILKSIYWAPLGQCCAQPIQRWTKQALSPL